MIVSPFRIMTLVPGGTLWMNFVGEPGLLELGSLASSGLRESFDFSRTDAETTDSDVTVGIKLVSNGEALDNFPRPTPFARGGFGSLDSGRFLGSRRTLGILGMGASFFTFWRISRGIFWAGFAFDS